jgi:hypothetical protein
VGLLTKEYVEWRAERTDDPRVSDIQPTQPEDNGWVASPANNRRKPTKPPWLSHALRIDREGRRAALTVLFNRVDLLLSAKNFEKVNELFEVVPTEGPSVRFLMGVLSITLPASHRLSNRADFFDRVWQSLIDKGRNAENLLGGLREWSRMDGTGPLHV